MRTGGSPERDDAGEPITREIARRLSRELLAMEKLVGDAGNSLVFGAISDQTSAALADIGSLILDGRVLPRCDLRLSVGAPGVRPCRKRLRIGVLPVAADPLHWNHLLAGLKAMARFELDKVVYIISGSDPRKPDLLRADVRYNVGRRTLRLLSPLFACSPLGRDEAREGEANIFRILQLNPCRESTPTTSPARITTTARPRRQAVRDTIAKLENGIRQKAFGYDRTNALPLRALRGAGLSAHRQYRKLPRHRDHPGHPFRNIVDVDPRDARRRGSSGHLATLPYSTFAEIQARGLYPRSSDLPTVLPPR